MPSLVVANAALVRLIWAIGGTPYAVNVLGAVNTGGTAATQTACNNLGTAIKAAVTSSGLGACLATTVTLRTVGLRNISLANQIEFVDAAAPVAGTSSANMLPPQVSLCVTNRTQLAGRSFRGRTFLPGFAEDMNDAAGQASAGAQAAAQAFMYAVNAALSAQSLPMAIIHRPTAAPLPVTAGFTNVVIAHVTRDGIWDTQRRRAVAGI